MSFLKRQAFWIVMGLVLLACGGGYAFVWMAQADNDAVVLALDTQLQELKRKSAQGDRIPGKGQVQVSEQYEKDLKAELERCRKRLTPPTRWKAEWEGFKWPDPAQNESLETFKANPTIFKASYFDRVKKFKAEDDRTPSGYVHFKFRPVTLGAFDLQTYTTPPVADLVYKAAKQLMIQLELVQILNQSRVVGLPSEGIRFSDTVAKGGQPAPGGAAGDEISARPSAKDDRRATHSFTLKADLDIKDVGGLFNNLIASSYNLAVTGLKMEKLKDKDLIQEYVSRRLLDARRQDEVVRVTLACEATEFLFPAEAAK